MSDARAWLHEREPAPPPALLMHMEQALDAVDAGLDLPARLAEAGIARLRAALPVCHDRAAALDLLAADALLTYAFEAAAEAHDDDAIERVRTRLAPARFAELLQDDAKHDARP